METWPPIARIEKHVTYDPKAPKHDITIKVAGKKVTPEVERELTQWNKGKRTNEELSPDAMEALMLGLGAATKFGLLDASGNFGGKKFKIVFDGGTEEQTEVSLRTSTRLGPAQPRPRKTKPLP